MKFISLGMYHYNLYQIACFWYNTGALYVQNSGVDGMQTDRIPDPHRAYYESLCRATNVIPAEVSE